MKKFNLCVPFLALLLHWPVSAKSGKLIESTEYQTQVLELYSTQSCSSCPPAQKWVSKLSSHPQLFKSFIPVVLHVDYWDYLGWKDPFSSNQFTLRQRRYASVWNSSRIYTPMFVLNGQEWRVSGKEQLNSRRSKVGVLRAKLVSETQDELSYEVSFNPTSKAQLNQKLVVLSSIIGSGISTRVSAGENSGKILFHDFLALQLRKNPIVKSGSIFKAVIKIPRSSHEAAEKHIVFWVANGETMRPIQSVASPL